MITNIITKLGAKQFIVTHGFGFITNNVVIDAEPIRLDFSLTGSVITGKVIYLDWNAQISTGSMVAQCVNINTQLNYKAAVEMAEEMTHVYIT